MGRAQGYQSLWRNSPGAGMQASEKGHPPAGAAVSVSEGGQTPRLMWGAGHAGVGSQLHCRATLSSSCLPIFVFSIGWFSQRTSWQRKHVVSRVPEWSWGGLWSWETVAEWLAHPIQSGWPIWRQNPPRDCWNSFCEWWWAPHRVLEPPFPQ